MHWLVLIQTDCPIRCFPALSLACHWLIFSWFILLDTRSCVCTMSLSKEQALTLKLDHEKEKNYKKMVAMGKCALRYGSK